MLSSIGGGGLIK